MMDHITTTMKTPLFLLLTATSLLVTSCGDSANEEQTNQNTSISSTTETNTTTPAPQARQETESSTASRSAMIGQVQCNFSNIILTRSFYLPDAAIDSEYYRASPGNVYLIICGSVQNTGKNPVGFQQPDFVSESYRSYDQEIMMHYKGEKDDWLTAKLNPGATHRFISCFELPEKEARKGVLRFEKEFFSLSDDNEVVVPLPQLSGQEIKDNITLPGVTDL